VTAAFVVLLLAAPPPALAADCGPKVYDCAEAQVRRGDFEAAIALLEPVLAAAPRDLKALNLLGIALTAAGRPEAGDERFRRALAIDPTFDPARKNLAINLFAAGRLAEARREFEAVLARAPADEVIHLHLGEIDFAQKDLPAAVAHYEQSGGRAARNPTSALHYAEALLARGQRAPALAVLEMLPADDANGRFEAGVLLGRSGAAAEAARFFASARGAYKDPYAAAFNQVLMLTEAGDHEEAIRVGRELIAGSARPPAELYSLVARAYSGAGRVQDAYDALREATRLEPRAPEHYIDLATICLEHHNYELGMEIVNVGLAQLPDSWMLHVQRGVLRAMKAELVEAERDFESARRLRPAEPVPWAALGMVWMQSGQTDKAVEALRAELPARKDHVVPYIFAVALVRSGVDPEAAAGSEAVEALRASIRANAEFAPARAELGRLLLKRGELEAAIAELERAIALDPRSGVALYNLAQAYRKKGDGPRAAEVATRVSRLNAEERGGGDGELRQAMVRIMREGTAPARRLRAAGGASPADAARPPQGVATSESADAHFRRGVELDRAGRPGEAVSAFEAALRLDPGLAPARYGLSMVAVKVGDVDGAIDLLRDVVQAAPGLGSAHYDLGLNLWNRHRAARGVRRPADLDEAERALRRAVALEPAQARWRLVLGQLLAERQRLDEAVRELREAARQAGADPAYAYDLGLALRRQGDLAGAEEQFRAALAGDPAHGSAHRALGLLLRQKDDLDGARAELRRSVELLPGDAQGHNVLGTVLVRRDDLAGAIESFRRATRLDPSLTEAHVNLAQALVKAGRREEARAVAAEVERLNADAAGLGRAMILTETASGLLDRGEAAAAARELREAVAASPSFAEAHYLLGLALRRSGTGPRERQAPLLRAVELEPDHAGARLEVARVLLEQGETDSGVLQLRRALARRPSLVEARRELARLAAASGDTAAAVRELETALVWSPRDEGLRREREAATAAPPIR
jgi:tetratricopeptide (TPR) repeat protein